MIVVTLLQSLFLALPLLFSLRSLSYVFHPASHPLTLKMSGEIDGRRTDSFPVGHMPLSELAERKLEWLQSPVSASVESLRTDMQNEQRCLPCTSGITGRAEDKPADGVFIVNIIYMTILNKVTTVTRFDLSGGGER